MAPRSRYNADELREHIKQGMSAMQLMETLGIKNIQTLQSHVMRLMLADNTVYKVPGLLEKDSATVAVTPKGDLRLSKAILEGAGVQPAKGDKYKISVKDGVITLKPE